MANQNQYDREVLRKFQTVIQNNSLDEVSEYVANHPGIQNCIFEKPSDVPHDAFAESVMFDRIDIIQYLYTIGVDINRKFDFAIEQGFTAAHWAALNCSVETLRYLSSIGLDFTVETTRQSTPLNKAAGTRINRLNCIQYFIEELHIDPNQLSIRQDTLLHRAALGGCLPTFKYLHENLGLSIWQKNQFGLTPVFMACGGSLSIVRYLIDKYNIDYTKIVNSDHNGSNYSDWRPIHYACEQGNLTIFKFFEEMGCDVNVPTYHGSNCLLIAAGSSLDLVRYLFEKYHHNPNVVNGFGENAAFVAARYGQFDVFKYILSVVDTDVFLVNKSGLDIYQAVSDKPWKDKFTQVFDDYKEFLIKSR